VLGLGGLIGPGAHIDIYGVYGIAKDDKAAREIPISKLILQNIPVLAVGEDNERGGGKPATPATAAGAAANPTGLYTLEVTPDEAEKLALASDRGSLHFTLRNPTDDDVVFTQGKDLLRLIMSYLDYQPKPPEAGRAKPGGVVIIKGTKQELVNGATSAQPAPGQAAPAEQGPTPVPAPQPTPAPAP
jgi:pilus assembly protein CpaB